MLDVCICTHNPRRDVLDLVIGSITNQKTKEEFNVCIVDNQSTQPLDPCVLSPLRSAGIKARIVCEHQLGLSAARHRAIRETHGPWILFVDDDNELHPDYVSEGARFISENPQVGCFGGKLILAPGIDPPEWTLPFLPYLGIRDLGDETITATSCTWTECEPPGAGAWVKRDVADLYVKRLGSNPVASDLGRQGTHGFFCADDSLMMRGAAQLKLANSYNPRLRLFHHISPHRFTFRYIVQLMAGFGKSQLILEKLLRGEHRFEYIYEDDAAFANMLDDIFFNHTVSGAKKVGLMMWHISARLRDKADLAAEPSSAPFTLVTPCLNAVKTIRRTLRSIEQQEYQNLQYIVCDGGSTDGTLDVLHEYEHLIDILIVEKDKNVADALNKGFARATGEIRGYLNADDCLAPQTLRKVAAIFRQAPAIDVITGSCERRFADGSSIITKIPENYLDVIALRNDFEQPSTFWRREMQEKGGAFDDSFYLAFDWEYWNRLKTKGAKFHRTDKLLSVYHFSDDNLTSRAGYKVVDEMYRITSKYAAKEIADAYLTLFKEFDLNGFYDVPFEELPSEHQKMLGSQLEQMRKRVGEVVVNNYNWNWASKQVRGLKWY